MKPKMIWANLVSENLDKTYAFYNALGFKANGYNSTNEIVSFSFGEHNFVINFFKKSRLENDFLGIVADTQKQNEIIFSLSAEDREEVDKWHEKVKLTGGKIISEPKNYDEGYTFVFADPDGHKYNVLYWPNM